MGGRDVRQILKRKHIDHLSGLVWCPVDRNHMRRKQNINMFLRANNCAGCQMKPSCQRSFKNEVKGQFVENRFGNDSAPSLLPRDDPVAEGCSKFH